MQPLDYSHDPPQTANPETWHAVLRELLIYYRRIAPAGRLPGRQHFQPQDVPAALPRLILLDVHRQPLRYKYRLVGTKEVDLYGLDPTGLWYDEVRPHSEKTQSGYIRLQHAVERQIISYRKGPVLAMRHRQHQSAENLVCPFASDGHTVDMIITCGVIIRSDGTEV